MRHGGRILALLLPVLLAPGCEGEKTAFHRYLFPFDTAGANTETRRSAMRKSHHPSRQPWIKRGGAGRSAVEEGITATILGGNRGVSQTQGLATRKPCGGRITGCF